MIKLAITVIVLTGAIAAPAMAQRMTVPINQLNMDAASHIERDGVRTVQMLLRQKGFDPGPIDGVVGPLTVAAIRSFQTRYGINSDGKISNQTLFALGAPDLAGQTEN